MVATISLILNSKRFQEISHFSRTSERQIPGNSGRLSNFSFNFQDFPGGSKLKSFNVTHGEIPVYQIMTANHTISVR